MRYYQIYMLYFRDSVEIKKENICFVKIPCLETMCNNNNKNNNGGHLLISRNLNLFIPVASRKHFS